MTIQTICNAKFIIYGTFKTNKTAFKMPRPDLCFPANLRKADLYKLCHFRFGFNKVLWIEICCVFIAACIMFKLNGIKRSLFLNVGLIVTVAVRLKISSLLRNLN